MTESMAAVLLAAGLSRRMGEQNKLHLLIDGVPLLRRSAQTWLAAGLDEIVVVLGHQSEVSAELIDDLDVTQAFNADYAQGQMTSVRCGLRALSGEHDGVFIALGDQPNLRASHIETLRHAFVNRDNFEVVVPFCNAQRGNPIVISAASRRSILAGERNVGCRKFIESNPSLVRRVEMRDSAVLIDLDTPADYQQFAPAKVQHG